MRGCLSLPFRLLSLLVLIGLGYLAWSYRDEIRRQVHRWTADRSSPIATGRAQPGRAAPAARRINDLVSGRADSVVLSASDFASLADSMARVVAPGAVDSIEVTLDRDDIRVRARVDTRAVPVSLGPLGGVVRDHEVVEAGGRLVFRRAGSAEWEVEHLRVRGIPLPREVITRLLGRFSKASPGVIGFPIPRTVTGLRVAPGGVTLYGAGR